MTALNAMSMSPDCNGVLPDSEFQRVIFSEAFVLLEMTNKSMFKGTMVSTGLLSRVTHPEGPPEGHSITPSPPTAKSAKIICVRIFKMYERNYTSLGTSTTPCRDIWHVALANMAAILLISV